MTNYLIIGPPRSGKSTYARRLREEGIPTYCTDPRSFVKEPEDDVTYAPEGEWSQISEHVARNWIPMTGPWCIEGVGAVRALRKYLVMNKPDTLSNIIVVVFDRQLPEQVTKNGQSIMAKSIATIWSQIRPLVKRHVKRILPQSATDAVGPLHNFDLLHP